MSNHFSADNLKFPGDDRRLDLTDLFVFASADHPGKTVLIIDSNPTSAPPPIPAPVTGPEFYPGAIYRINIDTDGRRVWLDLAVRRAAQRPVLRRRRGALHGFQWTGHDDFAGNNVDSIALEVPSDMPGGQVIGVWASISRYQDGILEQLDRGGNPTINPFINPDGAKNLFNSRPPADDVANYLEPWSKILENAGGYSPGQARAAALQVLPDILRYDRARPAAYPNGRGLTDDVYSLRFAWLTNGKVPPSGLTPHSDLLAHFPYLGPPNP
jgi:Domain of unknown function (DUF4331)